MRQIQVGPPTASRKCARLALSLALAVAVGKAAAQIVTASVIASGGGTSASQGGCFRLDATLGQPTAGASAGGTFILDAGFLPGNGDQDSIFNQGFEECS
jgi:hypothetical protein